MLIVDGVAMVREDLLGDDDAPTEQEFVQSWWRIQRSDKTWKFIAQAQFVAAMGMLTLNIPTGFQNFFLHPARQP